MNLTVLEPVGARIDAPVDDLDVDALRPLLAEHGVLIFADQSLDDEAFVAFLRGFGHLAFTPGETHVDGHPISTWSPTSAAPRRPGAPSTSTRATSTSHPPTRRSGRCGSPSAAARPSSPISTAPTRRCPTTSENGSTAAPSRTS